MFVRMENRGICLCRFSFRRRYAVAVIIRNAWLKRWHVMVSIQAITDLLMSICLCIHQRNDKPFLDK